MSPDRPLVSSPAPCNPSSESADGTNPVRRSYDYMDGFETGEDIDFNDLPQGSDASGLT